MDEPTVDIMELQLEKEGVGILSFTDENDILKLVDRQEGDAGGTLIPEGTEVKYLFPPSAFKAIVMSETAQEAITAIVDAELGEWLPATNIHDDEE